MNTRIQNIMDTFQAKYLKGRGMLEDEQTLGFVVLDDQKGVIAASTYDPNYVEAEGNPIKNWIIYTNSTGLRAFVLTGKDDFQNFLKTSGHTLEATTKLAS